MPFVPISSAEICDLSSRSSRYYARTVCRTWKNLNPATWHHIPEFVDLHPDGTGTLSSSFTLYTRNSGLVTCVASQEFRWKLGRDGPLGIEDTDEDELYQTIPKLMNSTKKWTFKPWTSAHRLVPAYIRLELIGGHSLESTDSYAKIDDFTINESTSGVDIPVEIIEYISDMASDENVAASKLLYVCKWTREMVLSRRRKERFTVMTKSCAKWGLAFWMICGHSFNPSGNPNLKSFYGFRSQVFKLPRGSGYYEPETEQEWDSMWDDRPLYYS